MRKLLQFSFLINAVQILSFINCSSIYDFIDIGFDSLCFILLPNHYIVLNVASLNWKFVKLEKVEQSNRAQNSFEIGHLIKTCRLSPSQLLIFLVIIASVTKEENQQNTMYNIYQLFRSLDFRFRIIYLVFILVYLLCVYWYLHHTDKNDLKNIMKICDNG